MTGQRRDWAELLVRLATLILILAPFWPDARTRWWLAMRACQESARRLGTLAIVAEIRYRQETP